MSKPLVLLSALFVAAVLMVTAGMFFDTASSVSEVRFNRGQTTSLIFLPPRSAAEARIVRHPGISGNAVDEVEMRDGSTKTIFYDSNMILRKVFAQYKGSTPDHLGPVMYTKTHDALGHLESEKHYRLDGSLEMDGARNAAGLFVRHLYYPGAGSDPRFLVVSSERVFDPGWKPVSQIDFRPDKTRSLDHQWQKDGTEVLSSFASDGTTMVWKETTKDYHYDRLDYEPDGVTVALETLNDYSGTTFKWFRADNSLRLMVKYTNMNHQEITLMTESGEPLVKQDWEPDYAQKPVNDVYPMELNTIDVYSDGGKVDRRYVYGLNHEVSRVIVLNQGEDSYYGPRVIYTIGADGCATNVETYDKDSKSDGGKPLTHADGKCFPLETWMDARPDFEQPKLKEGLKLYGEPPVEGPY